MIVAPGPILVVKLGGSLLDWPGWPARLRAFLAARPGRRAVVIVGGGRFADALRDLDRVHSLGEERAHVLALHTLDLTAEVAATLLPGSLVARTARGIEAAWAAGRTPILAPRAWFEREDGPLEPLPRTWATTTDSLAARVGARLRAAELVLLKSCPLPPGVATWEAAAALGLVDPVFPRVLAAGMTVELIDLRADAGGTVA